MAHRLGNRIPRSYCQPGKQLGIFENRLGKSGPTVGALEVGKQVDMVVLDRDPRSLIDSRDLNTLEVQETWIGGALAYSK